MRKLMFWIGWILLAWLPIMYGVQIYLEQDLPALQPWQGGVALAAFVLLYLSRERDDVLKHHLG